jgi:hypothetical protein
VQHRVGDWDWYDHLYNADLPVLENSWYASALRFALKMGEIIGDHSADDFLKERLSSIAAGFEAFWDGECYRSGELVDDRANAMAMLSGLCPKERYLQIRSILLKVFGATPYMENYVLTALCEMGYLEDAYRRMMARFYPMAQNRSSTLWEDFYILGSQNHAWSGAPVNIAFRYFLGLSSEDGFKTFTVNPAKEIFDHIDCCFPVGDQLQYVSYNRYTGVLKQTSGPLGYYGLG